MSRPLHHLALFFAACFGVLALTSSYWVLFRPDDLLTRPDNPRRVLAERRGPRGPIYDRNGAVLAEVAGEPGNYVRHYPYPNLAPVLGYVSPFYGLAGIEAAEDSILHGDAEEDVWEANWQGWLNQPTTGRGVRLTLDLRLQRLADDALANHTGALVLLEAQTGEILALASHPTFDANQLEDQWPALASDPRAPLLNRATLALYQPGGALQPIILAAALEAGLSRLEADFPEAAAEVGIGDLSIGCRAPTSPTETLTLAEAFQRGCPWPFAALGNQLGARSLNQLFADVRLLEAPALGLPTVASPPTNLNIEAPMAAVGQGTLTMTPLHLALLTAAIARQGQLPAPQIIAATQNAQGEWQTPITQEHPIAALTPISAEAVKNLMRAGHSAVALTGQEGQMLAWFSGFAPFENSRYVVVVLLEDGDVEMAEAIGAKVLEAVE